ncbi:MAG TPA: hypothetical protein VME46_20985 [Acidimicrobiales bacterium]|nr:hypothetical protein [Acidimicrobiales bacterium]
MAQNHKGALSAAQALAQPKGDFSCSLALSPDIGWRLGSFGFVDQVVVHFLLLVVMWLTAADGHLLSVLAHTHWHDRRLSAERPRIPG